MGKLDSYVSKAPAIVGSTTINHAARVRLGLNCSEYSFLDHLSRKDEKGMQADTMTVYINTGFSVKETEILFKSLILKGFIHIVDNKYELTSKWDDGFPDIEKEFEANIWKEVIPAPGNKTDETRVAWTGTKKKALEYYVRLRKQYSAEFLLKQRNDYFEFLRLQKKMRNFDQQRLMCQVFLNPATERFNEDYAGYIEDMKKKYGDPEEKKSAPVTKEEVMAQYGKNNNE